MLKESFLQKAVQLHILDETGRLTRMMNLHPDNNGEIKIDIRDLAEGLYYLVIEQGAVRECKSFVKR